MKQSLAFFSVLLLTLWLSACSIFGAPTVLDETKGWSAQRLYEESAALMRNSEFDKAIKYFEILESRFPNGKYAAQAQLEIAYANYKKGEPVLCISAADRFIKLHPNHPNIDYAYYIKGLASFNERGMIEKLTAQEISDRDPKSMRISFLSLKELVSRYPNSRYVKDAQQRMVYLVNSLAEHELHVARYYMKRTAYVAAVNRCKYLLENYPDSNGNEEALVILTSAYDALKMDDLKADTIRVLKTNYPESRMFIKGAPLDEKQWWKFWESL